jgi:hypothetical protein
MKAQEWLALMMSQWMMIWKMTRIKFDKRWTGGMARDNIRSIFMIANLDHMITISNTNILC